MERLIKQNHEKKGNKIDEKKDSIMNIVIKSKKSMTSIKLKNDLSYNLFNDIFNNREFLDINEKQIKINNFQKFYEFQKELNSNYKSQIKRFNYKRKNKIDIIKEIPYKSIKLRKISEEDSAIKISPNGLFVRTENIIKNDSESSLDKYNTVIGNAIIIKGVYYYQIKILKLGGDTNLCFGIISKDSLLFKKNENKNFPINAFNDGYGAIFNKLYEFKSSKKRIKEGDTILVKIDLIKNFIYFFINGIYYKPNKIKINFENTGFYPAFSLSNNKEILVNFGSVYDIEYIIEDGQEFDKRPICQMNNLQKIVICYINIIENNIIKIINHQQITYIDSLRLFYPMLHFFGNIAFKDEYIMKNYILNYMYIKYDDNVDIYQYFNSRYNLIYLIFETIEENKKLINVLFLLDCLCEEIKFNSYDEIENQCSFRKWNILLKLYNYFLQRKLFKDILFKNVHNKIVNEKLKEQLYIIFQPIKIFGISCGSDVNFLYSQETNKIKINKIIKEKLNKINIKNMLISFKELINTLILSDLENPEKSINETSKLINENNYESYIYSENYISSQNLNEINKESETKKIKNSDMKTKNENIDGIKIEKNQNIDINNIFELLPLKRAIKSNKYSEIFFNLIRDINNSVSDKYSFIPTIFFPILFLFNETYEKEINSLLINEQILSLIPFIPEDFKKMNNNNEIIIDKNILDKKDMLNKLISPKTLISEFNKKNYNISSYLLKIQMLIFSFLNDKLKIYDDLQEYHLEIQENCESINLNIYLSKFQDLLLIINREYSLTLLKTINVFVPYLNEIMNNNFYLLFPFTIVNEIKFIIKYFFIQLFITKCEWFKEKDIRKLINIFINLNLKILGEENVNKIHLHSVFTNFQFLMNLFNRMLKLELYEDEDEKNDNNYEEKSIDYYFKFEHFELIFQLMKKYYKQIDNDLQKIFESFMLNLALDISSEVNKYFLNNIIKCIEKDKNELFFTKFIINKCIKRKIIKKILKLSNIIEIGHEVKIDNPKLEKYCKSISCSLNFILECLKNKYIVKKFFKININIMDFHYEELEDCEIIDKIKKNNITSPLYYCFIHIISLITNKLLTDNFFMILKKVDCLNHKTNPYFLDITSTCISFFKTIIIDFSKEYQKILEKKKAKHLKKTKKNKTKDKNEEKEDEINIESSDEIKKYYINLFNEVNKNNFGKLIYTIEKYYKIISINFEECLQSLKKILLYLNNIQNMINTRIIDQEEEKKIEITCPICLDNYSDSHVLPCEHAFCWKCIQKLTNNKCPICRKPMEGVKEHPNFLFQNQMSNNNNNNPFLMNNHSNDRNSYPEIFVSERSQNPFLYSSGSPFIFPRDNALLRLQINIESEDDDNEEEEYS